MTALRVAVVGAGPAGLYTADALLRKRPEAQVDVIDRLFAPYGLVRYGVAPDHQGTKAVTRVFDRLMGKGNPRFLGGVTLGRDVSLAELRARYHAVVLAIGCPADRPLGVPGEGLPGVHGSGAFVGWYNAHPDHAAAEVDLARVRRAVVIGNGNVAIDVARILSKTPAELAASDLADAARGAIGASGIGEIVIVGRRGPIEAGFTNAELAELGRLSAAAPMVDAADLPEGIGDVAEAERRMKEANLATLRAFAGADPASKPKRIRFLFHRAPVAFLGGDRLEGVRLRAPDGTEETLSCELAVTCIGYRAAPPADVPFDAGTGILPNSAGRVAPGLYAVGWARRGPSGVIPTNRADGIAVADLVLADLEAAMPPREGDIIGLLAGRGAGVVTWDDWTRTDKAEIAAAEGGAPRRKRLSVCPA